MSGENGNDGGTDDGQTGGEHAGGNGQDGDNNGAGTTDDEGSTGQDSGTEQGGAGNGEGNGDGGTDWRKHAKTWETRAGEHKGAREKAERERDDANATVKAVLKAAGIETDETDPAKVAEQAESKVAERDATIRAMTVDRAAEKAARKAGADVDRLTDSRSFATAAAKLDPADDGFGDAMTALVEKHLDEHPHLRAKSDDPPPPSNEDMRNGGEGAGAGGSGSDDDDLDALSRQYAERN